ncbi:hypothetical protein HFO56_39405 [Rhizobium laguerreae]|uniref:hypothetical protein n=1 Tax=Rhizobium laguerreae TaxID=1076926 RepID=UPI001C90E19E|nr:hypothetical protein [Rhizobium laguerreae]MBY3158369.1 hypothetical protein [Rhizobium laguerreae]
MSDSEARHKIEAAIAAAVAAKRGGIPLTHAGAYDIAHAAALEYHLGTGTLEDVKELVRTAHRTAIGSYHAAQRLIAEQFVGSTLASILEDIAAAAKRFPVSANSDTPPDLAGLARSPENIELSSLLAYAIAVRRTAYRDLEETNADIDGDRELAGIEGAIQVLHMLTQQDIVLADLVDKPFDGQLSTIDKLVR